MRQWFRQWSWFWQRRRWGFDERELWSLDCTILKFVLPRLKVFRKNVHGYPDYGAITSMEDWEAALDKMIAAMQIIVDKDYPFNWAINTDYETLSDERKLETDNYHKVQEGLHLFFEYFQNLWN